MCIYIYMYVYIYIYIYIYLCVCIYIYIYIYIYIWLIYPNACDGASRWGTTRLATPEPNCSLERCVPEKGRYIKYMYLYFTPPPQNRCQGAANLLTHFLYSPHPSCMPLSQRPSSPSFFTGNTLHTQTYTTTTQRYESTSLD